MDDWSDYVHDQSQFEFEPGMRILDLGCGWGHQAKRFEQQGCRVVGLERDWALALACRKLGLATVQARAEEIPLSASSLDGVLCNVVISYTDEDRVVGEIARVLKPGATCYLVSHGAGYYLKYLLCGSSWKLRFYGLRSLVNTWVWRLLGRRLPGFLGDTLYQSRRRLAKYYRENGLAVGSEIPSRTFLSLPVFIYQIIAKTDRPAPTKVLGAALTAPAYRETE